jgi:hypothetical protein
MQVRDSGKVRHIGSTSALIYYTRTSDVQSLQLWLLRSAVHATVELSSHVKLLLAQASFLESFQVASTSLEQRKCRGSTVSKVPARQAVGHVDTIRSIILPKRDRPGMTSPVCRNVHAVCSRADN